MHPARRWLVVLSAAIAALLAVLLPLTAASALAGPAAATRVGASHPETILAVGASRSVPPVQGRAQGLSQAQFAAGACVAAENAGTAIAERGPSFIAKSNGEIVRVPEGASGPTAVRTGNGFQFTGGSGGSPLSPAVSGVRVMDPVMEGKFLYPNGYVSYFNELGQTVHPFTGSPNIAPSDPLWHWAWGP